MSSDIAAVLIGAALLSALDSAPPRIRLWLVLAAWCGLRAREIALLRAESIRLDAEPPFLIVSSESAKGGSCLLYTSDAADE